MDKAVLTKASGNIILEDVESYELIELLEPENTDIFVKVRRISDNKMFKIRMDWLTAEDEESPNYQLMEDYSGWWVNY